MNKKAIFAFTTAVFAQTTCIYSSSIVASNVNSEVADLKNRVNALEQNKDQTWTPTASRCALGKVGAGLLFTAEWLYWKASEKGLTYAIKGEHNSQAGPIPQTILPKGRSHHPDFDHHSGYRLGAGWTMPHDHWDVYSTYTRYHMHDHDSVNIGAQDPDIVAGANTTDPVAVTTPGQYIYPFWIAKLFINNLPATVNSASARWKLHLDMVDAELGKQFSISKWLAFRPHVGIRAAWIDQKYRIHFIRLQDPFTPSSISNEWHLHMKNDFSGIGLRGGFDTKWCLRWGFSIFGNAAFSLIAGKFDTHFKQTAQGFDPTGVLDSDDLFKNKNHLNTNVMITDMELGLEWNRSFFKNRFQFGIWAGYEQHIFFEQNQFMNFQYDFTLTLPAPIVSEGPNYFIDGGNLTTSGFVGGIDIGF
jgi:hypothetical protein